MRDMAHSIYLIKLYQTTMGKNFDVLFLTTLNSIFVLKIRGGLSKQVFCMVSSGMLQDRRNIVSCSFKYVFHLINKAQVYTGIISNG